MRFFRLLPLLTLAFLPAAAATLDLDGGLRASIWNDNHKLGVGGELGAIAGLGKVDLGLHLNYSHFASKNPSFSDVDELGGYVALYLLPPLDQTFQLRVGPHVGAAYLDKTFLDVGGDLAVVFQVSPAMRFYADFVPAYFIDFKGSDSEALVRVGLGLEFRLGAAAAAPTAAP
jgi:hypothetical protein